MPKENSAEAIENSVESAGALQNPQLAEAEAAETSVDSTEPIEKSSEEAPDVMSLLLGEDAETIEPKTVPEGQYLKLKASNKSMKQELERIRSQMTQPQPQSNAPQTTAPLQVVAEPPDPQKFDDGVLDPGYQKAYTEYQKQEITRAVQEQLVQQSSQMETNAYLSKYQERIDRSLPTANQRIEALKQKDVEFKKRIESPYIQQTLANLPPEALTAIAESNSPESIVNYYTLKPDRLIDLSKNSVDELLNLGVLIGKVNGVKGTRKTLSEPIAPLKSGDSTKKLHPIRDHGKYDHSTKEGRARWKADYDKLDKRS